MLLMSCSNNSYKCDTIKIIYNGISNKPRPIYVITTNNNYETQSLGFESILVYSKKDFYQIQEIFKKHGINCKLLEDIDMTNYEILFYYENQVIDKIILNGDISLLYFLNVNNKIDSSKFNNLKNELSVIINLLKM